MESDGANAHPITAYLATVRSVDQRALCAGSGAIGGRLDALEALRSRFDALEAPDLSRLASWRVLASNTLRRSSTADAGPGVSAFAGWDAANAHLAGVITRGEGPTVALAARLNALLVGGEAKRSPARDYDLYGGDGRYLPPAFVPAELEALDARLAAPRGGALLEACVACVGLVTIHPFEGGNGRTARLLADVILLSNGWLPLCFPSPIQAHVALTEGGAPRTVERAFATFLDGVKHSYACALGLSPGR